MSTNKSFIKRHPVLSYFVLTFFISWGNVLLLIGGPGNIPFPMEEVSKIFPMVFLGTVAGPIAACLILTGLISGKAGYRLLVSHLFKWRVNFVWYFIALLTAPLTVIAALFILSLFSPQYQPGFLVNESIGSYTDILTAGFWLVVGIALLTGFMEEVGWTGFAIAKMLKHNGVLVTGLASGLLWGAWHFLSNILGITSGGVPIVVYVPALLFTFLVPYRILMVWVYSRTESLLIAILMHASLVFFWLISTPQDIAGMSLVIWYLVWATLLWITISVVAIFK